MYDAPIIFRVRSENGITRHRHQHDIAGIYQRSRQDGKRRLTADGMNHLRLRVESYPAHVPQITRRRLLELRVAVVGVAAILRLARFAVEGLHNARIRHCVRLAHAQVKKLRLRICLDRRPFRTLDLLEFVDRRVLAVPLGRRSVPQRGPG